MFTRNNNDGISCEDVILYSNYLGIAEDSQYIRYLINSLTNLFIKKLENSIGEEDFINHLKFTSKEIKAIGPIYEEWLEFKKGFCINVKDNTFYLDEYGEIIGDNPNYIGKNILSVPILHPYIVLIRKQIFISKIYKAIRDNIEVIKGVKASKIFDLINEEYIYYEEKFKQKNRELIFPEGNIGPAKSLK